MGNRVRVRWLVSATLVVTLSVTILGAAGSPRRAFARQPSIEKFVVSDDGGNQTAPRISGQWVIFQDDRRQVAGTQTFDIRSWSLETKNERRLTDAPTARQPSVSGNLAVWVEPSATPPNQLDVTVYDIKDREIVRRIARERDQDFPAIGGKRVVWHEQNAAGSLDVVGYDLDDKSIFVVSDASGVQAFPHLAGDLVAFEDLRDSTIWYRDLKTNRLRRIEGVTGYEPAVSGERIVFRSGGSRDDPENAQIHVFDRATNAVSAGLATTLERKRGNPRIDGTLVVWWDSRDGDRDVYGYDLASGTEFKITGDSGDQDQPDVSNNVVVWTDRRGGDTDVRGARLTFPQPTPTPAPTAAATPTQPAPQPTPRPPSGNAPRDERYFPQTGFRVDHDRFWQYFNLRGGVKNFGYPTSRTFTLMGFTTQLFQRHAMQLGPDGPRLMNLLDPGLMPYTQINTSTFPGFDEGLAREAPAVGSPNYDTRIVDFIRQHAPDAFNGTPVAFFSTFVNQIGLATAFPSGGGNPSLIGLLNLELSGSVTSRPFVDPRNGGFIYQRFQRVIFHYDASCGCTQPILLGDWFKSIITGVGLPPDLAAQAQGSPFYMQYNNNSPNGLNRPLALPNTDVRFAFEQQ